MIDPLEVSILDRNSEALGIETSTLMDNAGSALASEIKKMIDAPASILFVCGKGNNGGDGFVAAKYLRDEGYEVAVLIEGDPITDLSRTALRWSGTKPVRAGALSGTDVRDIMDSADLIVDGLLGAGAKGPPRDNYGSLIEAINSAGKTVLSIDIPSGMGHSPCVKATATVTFHDAKSNMFQGEKPLAECGRVIIADIGIPPEASTVVGPGDLLRYPIPEKNSKKGDMGKVLVIGGGPYTGAPLLSSMGALRAGADLVRAAVPLGIRNVLASQGPDIIVEGVGKEGSTCLVPDDMAGIEPLIEWCDVVLIGPGAGRDPHALDLLFKCLLKAAGSGKRTVVDADGIHALARDPFLVKGDVLLTPHRGELKALIGESSPGVDPKDAAPSFALRTGHTMLLKGSVDVIIGHGRHGLGEHVLKSDPEGGFLLRENRSGHPAMSKGGTGDVLAGICAGLMARGMSTFDAACLGAYLNGKAGEAAFRNRGYSLTASDMLDEITIIP